MVRALKNMFVLPFKLAASILEVLGRSLAIVVGLAMMGFGALLWAMGPMIIFGVPLCFLGAIVVVKAL